ncbi:LPD1 domain-containing protein [Nannocystis pusilla]|uniref:LPD1 domain-containing protein n=1 Tax=Nannocystis pusilla TaxID=889268 RepID=UPI003B7A192E
MRAHYKEKMGEVTRRHRANELTHEQYREEYNKLARAHNLAPTKDRTTFSRDAEMLGQYFWTPTEMFARAFETWAEDKLQTQGRENTYLVYGTRVRYRASRTFREAFVEGLEPYPHGLERRSITDAVDRLVQALALHGLPK